MVFSQPHFCINDTHSWSDAYMNITRLVTRCHF